MSSRDSILAAIKQANGSTDVLAMNAEAQALALESSALHQPLDDADLLQQFLNKTTSEALTATAEILDGISDVPARVSSYLNSIGASDKRVLCGTGQWIDDMDWLDVQIYHEIDRNPLVTLTMADQAIAETGSLVVSGQAKQPFLLHYIGLHHLVVVHKNSIVPYLEDMQIGEGRSTGLITGTSGTADIEGRNTRGAHGPRFLHLFIT